MANAQQRYYADQAKKGTAPQSKITGAPLSQKYGANAQDVYSAKNLKTSMTGGVAAPNLKDPFGYAASLKQQYQIPELQSMSEKETKNINDFDLNSSKALGKIKTQSGVSLPVEGLQGQIASDQFSQQETALSNELAQINQRLGYAQQGYGQDMSFYTGQQQQATSASQYAQSQQTAKDDDALKYYQSIGATPPADLLQRMGINPNTVADTNGGWGNPAQTTDAAAGTNSQPTAASTSLSGVSPTTAGTTPASSTNQPSAASTQLFGQLPQNALSGIFATQNVVAQGGFSSAGSSQVTQTLNQSKGNDGYVNPGVYDQQKSQYLQSNPQATPQQFDQQFGSMLSPQNQPAQGAQTASQDNTSANPALNPNFTTNAALPDPKLDGVQNHALGGATQDQLYQDALSYIYQGTSALSNMGMGQAGQVMAYKTAVKSKAAAISKSLGIDEYQARALFKSNTTAATKQVGRIAGIETTSATLQAQFPRLEKLADQVRSQGVNITESDVQAGATSILQKTGSPEAASYVELLTTIRGDYTALQGAIGNSQGSEGLRAESLQAIPLGLTSEQYHAIFNTLQTSSAVARSATQAEVQTLIGGAVKSDTSTDTSSSLGSYNADGSYTAVDGQQIIFSD